MHLDAKISAAQLPPPPFKSLVKGAHDAMRRRIAETCAAHGMCLGSPYHHQSTHVVIMSVIGEGGSLTSHRHPRASPSTGSHSHFHNHDPLHLIMDILRKPIARAASWNAESLVPPSVRSGHDQQDRQLHAGPVGIPREGGRRGEGISQLILVECCPKRLKSEK